MKELDPRTFNKEEKQAFDEADATEWTSGAVALVPSSKESSIPKEQIFLGPMCFVSTNKSKETKHL